MLCRQIPPFTLIFVGIVLFLLFQFMDYPMEKPMLVFSCFNPVTWPASVVAGKKI